MTEASQQGCEQRPDDITKYTGYGTLYIEDAKGYDGEAMSKSHVPQKRTRRAREEAIEALKEGLRRCPKCRTISPPSAGDNYADKHRRACGAPERTRKITCVKCMRTKLLGFFPSHKCIEN